MRMRIGAVCPIQPKFTEQTTLFCTSSDLTGFPLDVWVQPGKCPPYQETPASPSPVCGTADLSGESAASSVLCSSEISENGVVSPATAKATKTISREDLAAAAEKMKKTETLKTRHGKRER